MNFQLFCEDHGIPIAGPGDRHYMEGWLNTPCPFCSGHDGNHLGFNKKSRYFFCWRCKFISPFKVIRALSGETATRRVMELLEQYEGRPYLRERVTSEEDKGGEITLPGRELGELHQNYLRSRNYDPLATVARYGVTGTGMMDKLKYRLVIPITYKGRIVSYTARDVTGKHALRYISCAKENEARNHKHCLYGLDNVTGDAVVVVEGVFDAWRLGFGAVATFGVSWTPQQALLLAKFKRRYILFDSVKDTGAPDVEAIRQAEALAACVETKTTHTEIIQIGKKDPDSLDADDARKLMQELGIQ